LSFSSYWVVPDGCSRLRHDQIIIGKIMNVPVYISDQNSKQININKKRLSKFVEKASLY